MASKTALEAAEHRDVGAQLRAAADRLRLNITQVARRAGLKRPTVQSAFDGGNVTLTTLRAILSVLGIERLQLGPNTELRVSEAEAVLARAALESAEQTRREAEQTARLLQQFIEEATRRDELVRLVTGIAASARDASVDDVDAGETTKKS
jgi:DNA-binding phage protein